ncbi:MAG: FAD binding domain-containing protein [Anaerolineae bacterium]|nr:FAD binding domain-containing protein [Anaerolineae bacterium]
MWTHYYNVTSLDQARELLAQFGARARVIAGGTDLIIELERGMRPGVDVVIDISRVPGQDDIRLEGGTIHLGPLVNHNRVVGSELIAARVFPLAQACWTVGSPQIRNRGTVAGNLVTASPANDAIPPLWAMDARVTLASVRGKRTLSLPEFYEGVRRTAMQPDEILVDIAIPALPSNARGTFLKLGLRKAQAISVVNAAAVLWFDGDVVADACITLGSVAPTIVRAEAAEAALRGRVLNDERIVEAARLATEAASPIDDVRGPASYRKEMVRVLVKRALAALRTGTERAGWPENPAMLWGPDKGRVAHALPMPVHHETDAADTVVTTINGTVSTLYGAVDKTLLDMLREDACLTGTKEGCAEGECGACTVLLDGVAVLACLVPAPRAHGAQVVTVEGLAQPDGTLHPLQQGFIDAGAVQCGYCTPGFLMAGASLLDEHPHPTEAQIRQSISGNLCRCTGYYTIVNAFEKAVAAIDAAR